MLRYSNVDSRLFHLAKKHFLLSDDEQATILKKTKLRIAFFDALNESLPKEALEPFGLKQKIKTKDYIKRPEVQLSYVLKKLNKKPKNNGLPTWCYKEVLRDVETDVKYEGYIKRHLTQIQKISKNETLLELNILVTTFSFSKKKRNGRTNRFNIFYVCLST